VHGGVLQSPSGPMTVAAPVALSIVARWSDSVPPSPTIIDCGIEGTIGTKVHGANGSEPEPRITHEHRGTRAGVNREKQRGAPSGGGVHNPRRGIHRESRNDTDGQKPHECRRSGGWINGEKTPAARVGPIERATPREPRRLVIRKRPRSESQPARGSSSS